MSQLAGFLRGTPDALNGLSPDAAQRALERYLAWSDDLTSAGNPPSGGALSRRGRGRKISEQGCVA